jgi:hypothetical protein
MQTGDISHPPTQMGPFVILDCRVGAPMHQLHPDASTLISMCHYKSFLAYSDQRPFIFLRDEWVGALFSFSVKYAPCKFGG